MLKKIAEACCSVKLTIISGIFFVLSLALLITKKVIRFYLHPFLDFAWVTVLISGYPLFFWAIYCLIKEKRITSSLLMSVAIIASICIFELFASAEIALLMAIGEILEEKTASRAKKGVGELSSLVPLYARIISDENKNAVEKLLSCDLLKAGMRVRVLAGETIPCDGKVVLGASSVDQKVITGESLPCDKTVGDEVYCGSVNGCGVIEIEVSDKNENFAISKMIALLNSAEQNKAPMQRIADRWAGWLVPIAMLTAIAIGIITFFLGGVTANDALVRAITVLVVFCPCALALSTPTCVTASIGQASKHSVIIKSGEALENMGKVDTFVFDKTGTLTEGKLSVTDVFTLNANREQALSYAYSLEVLSEHPLGKAISGYCKDSGISILNVQDFTVFAGLGVSGNIDGLQCVCGNLELMQNFSVDVPSNYSAVVSDMQNCGKAVVYLSVGGEISGVIALSDTIRDSSVLAVSKLKKMGYNVVLLSGDNKNTAEYVAKQVGISEVYASQLPHDKANKINEFSKNGRNVCMIGDGVNDAVSLKSALVGVTLSDVASDVTVSASDVVIMDANLNRLAYLTALSKTAIRTVKFNILASLLINLISIVLSAFGLINPILGAVVHNLGAVLVILNASLLYERNVIKRVDKL